MGFLTLSGLGSTECGEQPAINAGEKAMCCPNVGWVVYGAGESEYALCERAAALSSGGSSSSGSSSSSILSADDPLAAVEAKHAELDARREELEEKKFQDMLQEAQLRAQLNVLRRRKEEAAAAEAAKRSSTKAALSLEISKENREKYAKIMGWAVGGLVLWMALNAPGFGK